MTIMGAGASLPLQVDNKAAQRFASDNFNEGAFDKVAKGSGGTVPHAEFLLRAARAARTAAPADAEADAPDDAAPPVVPSVLRKQPSWCRTEEMAHAETLRIATLNVYFLRHPEDIAGALVAHLPLDVLALQEVKERSDLDVLAAALNMRVVLCVEASDRVGLSNAMLVRADVSELSSGSLVLDHPVETRAALWLELPSANARFICTHLDHMAEESRCSQFRQLERALLGSSSAFFLMGDFNALRRSDYDDPTWAALVRARADAGIDSETRLTDAVVQDLVDCRYAAEARVGSVTTSIHRCRIDYVWASSAALLTWTVRECAHVWLKPSEGREEAVEATTTREGDLLTDHALVVCSLVRRTPSGLGLAAPAVMREDGS